MAAVSPTEDTRVISPPRSVLAGLVTVCLVFGAIAVVLGMFGVSLYLEQSRTEGHVRQLNARIDTLDAERDRYVQERLDGIQKQVNALMSADADRTNGAP